MRIACRPTPNCGEIAVAPGGRRVRPSIRKIDDVIDPAETRGGLTRALRMVAPRPPRRASGSRLWIPGER
jgi:hypothetical protein